MRLQSTLLRSRVCFQSTYVISPDSETVHGRPLGLDGWKHGVSAAVRYSRWGVTDAELC